MFFTSADASWPWNPTIRRCPAWRTLSRMAPSSAPEPLAHRVADLAAIRRLALGLEGGHRRLHRLAHVLERGGARLRDRLLHRGLDVGLRSLRGQVALQQRDLLLLLLDQLRPVGLAELEDGVLALADEALEHARGLGVVERRFLLDLAVHERGLGHAQRARAVGVLRLHGRGEVLLDPVDERNALGHRPRISRFRAILPHLRVLATASRIAAALLALAALAPPAHAAAPLARLADALAGEIAAAVHGSAVEIAPPEDRTGSGGSLALDLASLLRARLEGRVRLVSSGPRVRVDSVLAEGPGRLWVSARLTEEPGGRLVDVLAASAESDPMLLSLVPAGPAGGAGPLAVVAFRRTPLVEGRVLDVAPVGEDRVLVLYEDALALYRLDEAGLALLSRHELPASLPVRFPGGTIYVPPAEGAAWVLTSRSPRAVLFSFDNGRLEERQQAEALFWPRTPRGLRYRPGTNLLEGAVADLGEGPFLRLDPRGAAVAPDGRLWMASPEGPRAIDAKVGGGLARPAPEMLA